ncbi:MAG TPA: hypothetical protein VH394_19355 [Thermoanaerobaculia bacterium]|jgi:hypothetical protein|nr:hypothetical protein [Thermoanaerobaculia bacterium]
MEDSSREHLDDQAMTESRMDRREIAKLLGVITALGASLGVTLITSAATSAEGAQLKLKFFKQAPDGDPAKAELLCTIDISPEDERKIVTAGGPVELRVIHDIAMNSIGNMRAREIAPQEVTISSQTIPVAAWKIHKIKDQ